MKSRVNGKIIVGICIAVILAAIIIFILSLRVEDIIITGNEKYSDKQIEKLIFKTKFDRNPVMLYFSTEFGSQKKIPFVARYSVKINSINSVEVKVYEKNVIGYVRYMEKNMYFDGDGIVTDSTQQVLDGIPRVTGLKFDYIVVEEKLPVKEEKLFQTIMNLTQLLSKYEIAVDKIKISEDKTFELIIGDITVELGEADELNEKIIDLHDMLPKMDGLNGTLDMTTYDSNDKGYAFKKN